MRDLEPYRDVFEAFLDEVDLAQPMFHRLVVESVLDPKKVRRQLNELRSEYPTIQKVTRMTVLLDYCTIIGCGGKLVRRGPLMVCTNCGAKYGEAR